MPIIVAEHLGEIVLLEENSDEDVGCRHRRKQQVPDSHRWRRPEWYYESEIDRMPHEIVKHRRLEPYRRHIASGEIIDNLMQAEQLEMVDHERASEHQQPACKGH